MTLAVALLAGMFGAAIGSFLNVVLYRLPRHESLSSPPSRCPACGTRIAWRDNIPVLSWLRLRGKCRACETPISVKYPLVELLTAVVFVVVALLVRSTI